MPAALFDTPYYAVIFCAQRTDADEDGYAAMATEMDRLASTMPGYLGVESTRDGETGLGITVSYWKDEGSIRNWKRQVDHAAARNLGREKWYSAYSLRVARVERQYDFQSASQES